MIAIGKVISNIILDIVLDIFSDFQYILVNSSNDHHQTDSWKGICDED